ncbi:MAG: PH domain-containing protein [Alphaproteobacteria bacterium]|nr:PH domain-containing protein [Alphaproteobacteria bacterium]
MSRYINRVLGPGEQALYAAEIHWYIYLNGVFVLILGSLIGRFGPWFVEFLLGTDVMQESAKIVQMASFAVIGLGAYLLLLAYVRQISTELVITNRRVIAKYGFIATTTFELMLSKVEGANIDQTIWGRLLGFGTVLVKGTGGGISPIDHVAAPYGFHNFLMKALEKESVAR